MQCTDSATVQHYTEVGSRKYWISILTTPGRGRYAFKYSRGARRRRPRTSWRTWRRGGRPREWRAPATATAGSRSRRRCSYLRRRTRLASLASLCTSNSAHCKHNWQLTPIISYWLCDYDRFAMMNMMMLLFRIFGKHSFSIYSVLSQCIKSQALSSNFCSG